MNVFLTLVNMENAQGDFKMAENVMVYALSTCIHCRNAKEFLREKGIDFDFVDVDVTEGEEREKVVNEIRKINPELTFPTIIIGNRVIVGFRKDEIERALNER